MAQTSRHCDLLILHLSGTGKTLMARQIGKMLNTREPKIISGPGIHLCSVSLILDLSLIMYDTENQLGQS